MIRITAKKLKIIDVGNKQTWSQRISGNQQLTEQHSTSCLSNLFQFIGNEECWLRKKSPLYLHTFWIKEKECLSCFLKHAYSLFFATFTRSFPLQSVFYNNVAPSSRRGEWRMRGNICHMRVFAKCFPLVYAGGLLYFSFLETNKGAIKQQTVWFKNCR